MKKILAILLLHISVLNIYGQSTNTSTSGQVAATNTNGQVKHMPQEIMIIPKVIQGQDIRTILDQDPSLRIAITKMGEYFQNHGFRMSNFEARLQAALSNRVFTSSNQGDEVADLIRFSNPDIYVVLDVIQVDCNNAKIATINMKAYYTATGLSIGDITANSACNRADFSRLIQNAIDINADRFLNMINTNLQDLEQNGVPIYVEIGFSENSVYSMSSSLGPNKEELSDVIDKWFEQNTFKNQYSIQGTSAKLMILSDVRIPMHNQVSGANYSPQKFGAEISKFLTSLGLDVKKRNKGSSLYFTIN